MRVLMTGHEGYVGTVMTGVLRSAGHDVVGLDSGLYRGCDFGPPGVSPSTEVSRDIRDVGLVDLAGFDAVVHLAALSNDPLGNQSPELTFDINHRAAVRLAELARTAGVPRFLFASSCSLYGVAGDGLLGEDAAFRPITPYGESKVRVELEVSRLATDDFSPTFLRNATAHGVSPRLRADIVVNNLVGHACTTGVISILSDGTPWRPMVHVQDFAGAFLAALEAPRELVHNEAFNVGRTDENYRVSDLADIVAECVPGSVIRYAAEGGPDPRSYRVDCSKLESTLPGYRPRWTVRLGVEELRDALQREELSADELFGPRHIRLKRIQTLQDEGRLGADLRWAPAVLTTPEGGSP